MTTGVMQSALATSFQQHSRLLWGVCYRMTGSSSDADDLVQDTFARAMDRPPTDVGRDIKPWLVKVAINLSRDLLRKRKRRGYVGPWLPTPVELAGDGLAPAMAAPAEANTAPNARYELIESVSFAFLFALEELTATRRAVLLLRDVFDYTGRETATALEMTEGAVKTALHRARQQMKRYTTDKRCPNQTPPAHARAALESFVTKLVTQDAAGVEALLAADVRALSDGGGEFTAARVPVIGRSRVAKFYLKIAAKRPQDSYAELRTLNGMPALTMRFANTKKREAPRLVLLLSIDADGHIDQLYSVLASGKLGGIFDS